MENIQAGIGDKFSVVLSGMATFFGGFILAYVINWKVALVNSVIVPLIFAEAKILSKVN